MPLYSHSQCWALKDKPTNTPHIHIAHPTPYWLANYPTATHDGAIRNLRIAMTKEHVICEFALQMAIQRPDKPKTFEPLLEK
jgi:hypothetical protein